MGLGKSIQAITILWTLLRQGPTGKTFCSHHDGKLMARRIKKGEPIARKAVVACPASLVGNWGKEVEKWLNGQLKCLCIGESSKKTLGRIGKFQYDPEVDLLIISYDQVSFSLSTFSTSHIFDLTISCWAVENLCKRIAKAGQYRPCHLVLSTLY